MGVTVPQDYCFHCHEDIAVDRPSHQGLAFNSCAIAGCHNYHDNSALYEKFLYKHLDEPDCLAEPLNPVRKLQKLLAEVREQHTRQLTKRDADAPGADQPL